jgi:small subunit ribosomal protein S16
MTRLGAKKRPFYRIVAADSRSPRDGRFIEQLGHYDPMKKPSDLKLDLERVDHWLSVGAQPSETVSSLIGKARAAKDAPPVVEEAPVAAPVVEAAAEEAPAVEEAVEAAPEEEAAVEAAPEEEAAVEAAPEEEAAVEEEASADEEEPEVAE